MAIWPLTSYNFRLTGLALIFHIIYLYHLQISDQPIEGNMDDEVEDMVIESVTPVKNAIEKSKKSVSFAIEKNETHELENESQSVDAVDASDGKQSITYDRDFLLNCSKSQICQEYPQDWDNILQKSKVGTKKANLNNNETITMPTKTFSDSPLSFKIQTVKKLIFNDEHPEFRLNICPTSSGID